MSQILSLLVLCLLLRCPYFFTRHLARICVYLSKLKQVAPQGQGSHQGPPGQGEERVPCLSSPAARRRVRPQDRVGARLQGEELATRKLHMALASLAPVQQEVELARLQAGHTRPSISFLVSPDPPVMGSLTLTPEAASELEESFGDDLEEDIMDDTAEEDIKKPLDTEVEFVKPAVKERAEQRRGR